MGVLGALSVQKEGGAESLLVYCSQEKKNIDPLLEGFQAKNPDCTLKVIYLTPSQLENRLNQEFSVSESSADVILVPHQGPLDLLKRDQRLLTLKLDSKQFLKNSYDGDHTYYGLRLMNVGIAYSDTERTSFVPTSWADLTNEKLKGHLVIPAPKASEDLYVYAMALSQLKEDFIENLLKNDPKVVGSLKESTIMVGMGNIECGIALDYQVVKSKNEGMESLKFIYPKEGAISLFDGVAVIKTTKNPEDSMKLVKFLLSEESQQMITGMGFISVRSDVLTPLGYPTLRKITFMEDRLLEKASMNAQVGSLFNKHLKNKKNIKN